MESGGLVLIYGVDLRREFLYCLRCNTPIRAITHNWEMENNIHQ